MIAAFWLLSGLAIVLLPIWAAHKLGRPWHVGPPAPRRRLHHPYCRDGVHHDTCPTRKAQRAHH